MDCNPAKTSASYHYSVYGGQAGVADLTRSVMEELKARGRDVQGIDLRGEITDQALTNLATRSTLHTDLSNARTYVVANKSSGRLQQVLEQADTHGSLVKALLENPGLEVLGTVYSANAEALISTQSAAVPTGATPWIAIHNTRTKATERTTNGVFDGARCGPDGSDIVAPWVAGEALTFDIGRGCKVTLVPEVPHTGIAVISYVLPASQRPKPASGGDAPEGDLEVGQARLCFYEYGSNTSHVPPPAVVRPMVSSLLDLDAPTHKFDVSQLFEASMVRLVAQYVEHSLARVKRQGHEEPKPTQVAKSALKGLAWLAGESTTYIERTIGPLRRGRASSLHTILTYDPDHASAYNYTPATPLSAGGARPRSTTGGRSPAPGRKKKKVETIPCLKFTPDAMDMLSFTASRKGCYVCKFCVAEKTPPATTHKRFRKLSELAEHVRAAHTDAYLRLCQKHDDHTFCKCQMAKENSAKAGSTK